MKRKHSAHRARYALLAGITITITIGAIAIVSLFGQAGGKNEADSKSKTCCRAVSAPCSPMKQEGGTAVPADEENNIMGSPAAPPASTPAEIRQDQPPVVTSVEGAGGEDDLDTLQQRKLKWIFDWLEERTRQERAQEEARQRADLAARIDAYLSGSPMAGLGEVMVANAERTGVWVMLCPAQAYAESSIGRVNLYPYQAWGMYGVHPSSWEDGVARYFDNIVAHWGPAQNCHELVNPDYCEPPEPYNTNVQRLAESI